MRHVGGLLLGLVVTAVVLGGAGWATHRALTAAGSAPSGGQHLWIGLGAMAAAGLVVGLVVAGRVSPLATFVPSLVLLSWTVVYALDAGRALAMLPDGAWAHQLVREAAAGARTLLAGGVFGLLGTALFIPALMPSRWSRPYEDDEEYEEEPERGYQ